MAGMRDLLGAGWDLTLDDQKQGLDWLGRNEPLADDDMKEIDRILGGTCEAASAPSGAGATDTLVNSAAVFMNKGVAANIAARDAFAGDDLERARSAPGAARMSELWRNHCPSR